ncbi:MAG: MCE family protein [Ignavibacteria bacterium]|nr:MCE family protein [Ignavibacteria bacterium]
MEINNEKKLKVGLFIIAGFILFIIVIFVLGGKDNIFTPTITIKSEFETVSGLKTGGSVRLNGIVVGKIYGVDIVAANRVLVTMTIVKSNQKYIKKDSKATIGSDGLVGNKLIDLTPGTPGTPEVQEGEMIASVKPIEVADIMNSLKESGVNASNLTKDLSEISAKVNKGEGTLGQLINNDNLYRSVDSTFKSYTGYSGQLNTVFAQVTNTVGNVSGDLQNLSGEVSKITREIAEIVRKMNSNESIVGTLITDTAFANNLKQMIANANLTTQNLENGSFSFSQNMEALKHNFLFKGYFEDIGYWDKTDWEKNYDKKALEIRIKEQELIKKEKELRELEQKLKLEQQINNKN